MSAKRIQQLLAAIFFVLGGWCLVAPGSVLDLAIRPEWRSDAPIVTVLIGAFGAQALIAGLFAATSSFTRMSFALYGAALLPFFVFDYYFYAVEPMLTKIGLLDAVGNVVMLILCWLGWKRAPNVA
jgi:hypothetical protein